MHNITVDKLINWLQTIPEPEKVEVNTLMGNMPIDLKRVIVGQQENYYKDGSPQRFVIFMGMGQHFFAGHDHGKDWKESGQLVPNDCGGENINDRYANLPANG